MPRDAVIGAVVLAFAGLYWLGAGTIRHSSLEDAIGAAGLPHTLAVILAVLAVLLIVRALVFGQEPRRVPAENEPRALPRPHLRALGMLALGIGYLLVVSTLGYVVSVVLLLGAVALYVGYRPSPALAVFAIVGAAGFYVLFVQILDIPLPPGIWPKLIPV